MEMIMYVLNDPDRLDDLLDAWHSAGILGITIFDSTGVYRRRPALIGARYAMGFPLLVDSMEKGHNTLFATVDGPDQVQHCLAATESVVGDLSMPNTGIFAAWELSLAKKTILPSQVQDDDHSQEDGKT